MKIIIANWKMNPLKLKEAKDLVAAYGKVRTKNKIVVCPPAAYLPLLKTKYALGAQNIAETSHGAFTGEISAEILKQFKIKYAIIGHSERRHLGETDQQVNTKLQQAINNKIVPILCVGYGLELGEEDENILMHLKEQLQQDLQNIDPKKVIVAYEPVWAIGSGKPASPEHAERVAMFIRIKFKVGKVLYGGSTDAWNFSDFLNKEIDGLLVGGASLKKDQFPKMMQY